MNQNLPLAALRMFFCRWLPDKFGRSFILSSMLMLFSFLAFSQAIKIKGKVLDEQNSTLAGASILVNSTTVLTNSKGIFEINASAGDSIIVTYVGYETQRILFHGQQNINITLRPTANSLSNVVVVGYGTQKKATVSGAVGSVKGSDIKTVSVADASSLLQGRMAGVTVQSSGSAPGQTPSIVIRGTGTFGNDQPLYVIDGMISLNYGMSFINPNDIQSIEVLKDASAAAIYGSRAANGVVLVTTKKGTTGDIKISFNVKAGLQSPSKKFKFLNARRYADWNNTAHDNDGLPRAAGNDAQFNPAINTDWQNLSLGTAPIGDYNLSVSGGSESAKYFLSGEYFDQKGIVTDSRFTRYNLRANSAFTKGKFKITEAMSLSRSLSNPNTYFGRETAELPTMPVYDSTKLGGYGGLDPNFAGVARVVNWYGLAHLDDNLYTTDQLLGNVSLEYEIIKGLKYKLNVGLDYSMYHAYDFTPAFYFSNSQEANQPLSTLTDSYIQSLNTLIENTLTYNKSFGDHHIELLAGYTSQKDNAKSIGANANTFPNPNLRVINASLNPNANTTGDLQKDALQSIFGRVNYDYKSRYLLTATIRRDGSSKFLYPTNTFANFPSISIGWRPSEEKFFPKNGWINDLKIRGSYGILGSQNIPNYVTSSTLNVNSGYYFAGGVQSGISVTQVANPDVKWESAKTTDIGTDISMFHNQIQIAADYFNKTNYNILVPLPIPAYGGVGTTVTQNAASINNKGVEFAVTYTKPVTSKNQFKYSITALFSKIKNNVVSLGQGVSPITGGGFTQQSLTATRTDVGQPVGSFWGYQVLGIYQTDAEASADGRTDARAGDFKFSKDPTWLGSPFPKFDGGLNFSGSWKNFDINLFFQGVFGNKIWDAKRDFQYILDYGSDKNPDVLRAWTPTNTNTNIPRVTQADPANNKRSSSFYVEDGSYVRLKNLSIGYTLPQSTLSRLKITSVKFYVSGQNLLTFTKYKGYDPEVGRNSSTSYTSGLFSNGVDVQAYPNARIISAGIDLNF